MDRNLISVEGVMHEGNCMSWPYYHNLRKLINISDWIQLFALYVRKFQHDFL